jgi:predicted acyl esterase
VTKTDIIIAEVELYRDLAYLGGIGHFDFLKIWRTGVRGVSPRWQDAEDFIKTWEEHPFYDDYWKSVELPLEEIDLPVFIGAAQMLIYHQRGPYQAYRRVASKNKYLQIVDTNYYGWPNRETAQKLYLFAERYLKGVEHLDLERIGLQMRVGHGDWYWRTEEEWEIPGTEYIDWHLQADHCLSPTKQVTDMDDQVVTYAADVPPQGGSAGVTFVSKPFGNDVELAGHFAATLSISSTSHDADIFVLLWVLDEDDKIVRYQVDPSSQPFATGFLCASHRKTDPKKNLPAQPWHTHTEKDHAPLNSGEVVEVNVEIWPATARVRAGWRLRMDILPSDDQPNVPGYQVPKGRCFSQDYHEGAKNSIHLGEKFQNFVRLPVVPMKEIGPLNVVT